MSNPKECQGRAYHTPSAANPNECFRCHARLVMLPTDPPQYRYQSTPLSELPTGDMGE